MKVQINWKGQRKFAATTGSGHLINMDGPPDHGGENFAARPMELILVGLGGCSAFDVVEILEKSRQQIEDCQVKIDAERADSVPAVFTKIHMQFSLKGENLSEKIAKRAVELSIEKYCSVVMMLKDNVEITYEYEML